MICTKCPEPALVTLLDVTRGETRGLCLRCYYGAPEPVAAPVVPLRKGAYATLDEAAARARKVFFHLGREPQVQGNGSTGGFSLDFDSPLVPGYKGPAFKD